MFKLLNLPILLGLALITGCALENPEEANAFKFNFEGTTFNQVRFRSIDDGNAYRFHQGLRTIAFQPNEFTSNMSGYIETGFIPCFGAVSGTPQAVSKEEFTRLIDGDEDIDTEDSNNNGVYDIFEPYGQAPVEQEVPEGRVDLVEYFYVINIDTNGVSPGCPVNTDQTLYYQYLFYQNGDLVMRDYNREIEFFFRPQ